MTGKKNVKQVRRKASKPHQQNQSVGQQAQANDEPTTQAIKTEQPAPVQVVRKIVKAENEEARTLKTVFKSNPDSQMKEFIKKASSKPTQVVKNVARTPAESHPPAVAQELLDTDDDVADNLGKLFKASKSLKNT